MADEATTLAVVSGVVFGAMHVRRSEPSSGEFSDLLPDSLPDDADSLVAEQLLQLLGLPREEAAEIASRLRLESTEQLLPATGTNDGQQTLTGRRTIP